MNRILLDPAELDDAGRARLADDRARHIREVLRLQPGDSLRIGLLEGPPGVARLVAVEPDRVELECRLDPETPPRPRIDLLLALPRPKVMKRLWAQLAALGVGRIILTRAAQVERAYFDTHWLQPEGYRPLLIEGLQQAGATHLPQVEIHRRFKPLIEDRIAADYADATRIAADPAATRRFRDLPDPLPGRALVAVGPEGGWTPFEWELLQAAGFIGVNAGPRILRTDTACIALLSLTRDRLE